MGKETGISWTEATWNPWRGCTKVTDGCDHCYMFRDQRRYGNDPEVVVRAAPTTFQSPLHWDEGRLVFTCSWSDWFHVDADPWRDEAWDIIRRSPQHTFQILTKRPGRILRHLPEDWGDGWPNVWLGVSVERADVLHRVDQLRAVPAALRFISAEPLLGSLISDEVGTNSSYENLAAAGPSLVLPRPRTLNLDGIGWVIVGGESGSRADARPMHPQWAREIRDACLARYAPCANCQAWPTPGDAREGRCEACGNYEPVIGKLGHMTGRPAFHFKQWGSWAPDGNGNDPNGVFLLPDGAAYTAFAADAYGVDLHGAVRMGYAGANPKSGGKHLDDIEWCEIPEHDPPQLTLA